MITLSDKARELLAQCLDPDEVRPIRVYSVPGGCRGPMLVLALDEAHEDFDELCEAGGFRFCMARELAERTGGVDLDADASGFSLSPRRPLAPAGGCSGSCSSCGPGCAGA